MAEDQRNPDINVALIDLRQRFYGYFQYENYYRGEHRPMYSTIRWREAYSDLFKELRDNLCPIVVDAPVDKLEIIGFSDRNSLDETTSDEAMAWWQRERGDERSTTVHLKSGMAGDGFAMLEVGLDGQVHLYAPNPADCYVHYSTKRTGDIEWAAKRWTEGQDTYLALYYPNRPDEGIEGRIETYVSRGSVLPNGSAQSVQVSGFEPVILPGADAPVRPWPFAKVPMFHFPANSSLGEYGVSDLHNIVPIQDALNKSLANMIITGEYASYPQRWAVGIEPEYDNDGNEVPFTPGVDRVWTVVSEMAKFGQFEPADISKFIEEQQSLRGEAATVSRTPRHWFGLNDSLGAATGTGIEKLEEAFNAKNKRRKKVAGNIWEDLVSLALQIENSVNQTGEFVALAPATDLEVQWASDSESVDLDKAQALQLWSAAGVPLEVCFVEIFGWTAAKAARVAAAKAKADAQKMEQQQTSLARGIPSQRPMPPHSSPETSAA